MTELLGRRFGLPGLLSLSLHGAALVAAGVVIPWGQPTDPKLQPAHFVNLVELEAPAAPPAPSVAALEPADTQPPVPRKLRKSSIVAMSRMPSAQRVRVARARASVQAVKKTLALRPVAPVPVASRAPEPVQPASSSPALAPEPATLPEAESAVAASSLSVIGAVASLSRPLPAMEGGPSRVLRDSAAEVGMVRTKVRMMGDNPRPEYPRAAREAGWAGTVVLWVEVLPDGTVGAVTLHKSSGHPVLDEAARASVQDWRFVPAMDGNFPLRSLVQLPVRFDLRAAN
jgi:protein TonB